MTSRDILLFGRQVYGGGVKYRTFSCQVGHVPLDAQMKFLSQKLHKEISITYYQGFCYTFIYFMKILTWQKSAVLDPPHKCIDH